MTLNTVKTEHVIHIKRSNGQTRYQLSCGHWLIQYKNSNGKRRMIPAVQTCPLCNLKEPEPLCRETCH